MPLVPGPWTSGHISDPSAEGQESAHDATEIQPTQRINTHDLPNLDLLRAVAVLSVLLEHSLLAFGVQWIGPWEVGWIGVVGVFLFFVHTSLVLMWSLERKPHTLDFYIRRSFRIYPLAWLAIAITLAFHAPVSGTPTRYFHFAQLPPGWWDRIAGWLLVSNLTRTYYLPLGVFWSLPYEVEMYVFLPLLFFFVRRKFSLWPLLILWALQAAFGVLLFPRRAHSFFLAVPYFLPGIMAYVGFARRRAVLPSWTFPLALLLLWAVFLLHPGWREADFLCLAAGLGLPFFAQIRARWLRTVAHQVAKYSFGIYVMHPFAIVLGVYLLPHRPLSLQVGVILGSTALLAVCAYHGLESPMIRLGSRLARRAERFLESAQVSGLRTRWHKMT